MARAIVFQVTLKQRQLSLHSSALASAVSDRQRLAARRQPLGPGAGDKGHRFFEGVEMRAGRGQRAVTQNTA